MVSTTSELGQSSAMMTAISSTTPSAILGCQKRIITNRENTDATTASARHNSWPKKSDIPEATNVSRDITISTLPIGTTVAVPNPRPPRAQESADSLDPQ